LSRPLGGLGDPFKWPHLVHGRNMPRKAQTPQSSGGECARMHAILRRQMRGTRAENRANETDGRPGKPKRRAERFRSESYRKLGGWQRETGKAEAAHPCLHPGHRRCLAPGSNQGKLGLHREGAGVAALRIAGCMNEQRAIDATRRRPRRNLASGEWPVAC
jgi:hypothetical protein